MRVKVRNTQWSRRDRYAFHIPEFIIYEGDVVAAPKWAEKDTVCLTTGNPDFPVRFLAPDAIVSMDDVAVTAPKPVTDTRVVQVEGSKGQTYTVTISPQGKSCTCPGFGFRKSCKHVLDVS